MASASENLWVDDNVLKELPEGSTISRVRRAGWSPWATTTKIVTRQKDKKSKSLFTKAQSGIKAQMMMRGAYESELLVHQYCPEHVPTPHTWGNWKSDPDMWFYLCDYHGMVSKALPKANDLISIVSKIHRDRMGKSNMYGLHVPTYLGTVPNDNTWQTSWEVWFTQAMKQMFALEESCHERDDELDSLKEAPYTKVIPSLLRPLETGGRSIQPCLIHSDLTPESCKYDFDTDVLLIFDSCGFWGHNEAELGCWRAPRYRLGRPYLDEYRRVMGMSEQQEDWEDHNALYALRYDVLWAIIGHGELAREYRDVTREEMRKLIMKYPQGLEGYE